MGKGFAPGKRLRERRALALNWPTIKGLAHLSPIGTTVIAFLIGATLGGMCAATMGFFEPREVAKGDLMSVDQRTGRPEFHRKGDPQQK
jgi:hypothetical protein